MVVGSFEGSNPSPDKRCVMGRPKSRLKKVRVTIDLSPQRDAGLTRLKDRLEAESKAAVVRQSLLLYTWFLDQLDNGERIFIGKDRESAVECNLVNLR